MSMTKTSLKTAGMSQPPKMTSSSSTSVAECPDRAHGMSPTMDGLYQFGPRLSNLKIDVQGSLEQTIQVIVYKRDMPVINAHALPNTVTQHEPTVINRNNGLFTWDKISVYVNFDIFVAHIFWRVVGRNMI
jgi:hypothetical protein